MPTTTLSDVTVSHVLTNVSIMYTQEARGFVSGKVFAYVPVDEEKPFYFKFDLGDMFRIESKERRPGGAYEHKTIGITKETLDLKQYALASSLPDELRMTKESPVSTMEIPTKLITHDLMLQRERDFWSVFLNSGGSTPWANADFTGTSGAPSGRQFLQWNQAASTPFNDIKTWIRDTAQRCGQKPNVLTLDPESFDALTENPNVLSRLPDTDLRDVKAETIAQLTGLSRIVVGEAVYNTAAEGAGYSGDYIAPRATALLAYTPAAPAVQEVSAGYTFGWTEFDEVRTETAESGAFAVKQYYDEERDREVVKAKGHYEHKITAAEAGVRITGIIA